jgi:hypothetical protein
MKKIILLLMGFAAGTASAQTVLGTKSNDSLSIFTNNIVRMAVKADGEVRTYSRLSVNNCPPYFQGDSLNKRATAAVKRVSADAVGLLVSDNPYEWLGSYKSQLGVINTTTSCNGISVNNLANTSNLLNPQSVGISSMGGNIGVHRLNSPVANSSFVIGYNCSNYAENAKTANFTSYRSTGVFVAGNLLNSATDFSAEEWYPPVAYDAGNGSRTAVYIGFEKRSGMTAAWGVYQSHTTVKNHFNGTTLFGSATDQGIDKVQVTGSLRTQGVVLNITSKNANYTAINTDHTILATANGITITLPISTTIPTPVSPGQIFVIKYTSSGGSITLDPDGSATIDGAATTSISTSQQALTVQYDGTNYHIIAKN